MIDEIFQMIDWNNESEIQERGIELGKQFADFTIFFQPIICKIYNNKFEGKRRENWFKNLTNLQKQLIK